MFKTQLDRIRQKNIKEDVLIRWHHILMTEYGWIHPDEFKELPIATVINLLTEINKDREEMERRMKKK